MKVLKMKSNKRCKTFYKVTVKSYGGKMHKGLREVAFTCRSAEITRQLMQLSSLTHMVIAKNMRQGIK